MTVRTVHLKLISGILLVVLLALTVNGVHAHSHGTKDGTSREAISADHDETTPSPHCPCPFQDQHEESDGCDSCANCACHAPLLVQFFQFEYNPIILALNTSDTFKHLPEVFLSRFIPPQIQA